MLMQKQCEVFQYEQRQLCWFLVDFKKKISHSALHITKNFKLYEIRSYHIAQKLSKAGTAFSRL